MADSRPIFLSTYIKAFLISLNNNFGTLTTLFWAVSLLTYNLIILCPIIQDPSLSFRVYILTDKIFTIPRCLQEKMYFIFLWKYTFCMRLSSVPTKMLLKLPTIIGFAENQLSWSVLSFTLLTIVLRISLQR